MIVIPAIDLRRGRCVRLRQGDFARETVYSDDPLQIARSYRDEGFTRLHVVDLDGAQQGVQEHQALVREIVDETGLEVQLGGGIRDRDTLDGWLQSGVIRCVIGSLAVTEPDTVVAWLNEFGPDAVVLALDVRGDGTEPRLATHGWTRDADLTLWQALARFSTAGAVHVLCTDVARDGMMQGPNLALYREFVDRYPAVRLQASGGIRDVADLVALRNANCAAAITGRALLDATIIPSEVASFLRDA